MSRLELSNIVKNFGAVEVIRDVSLAVEDGEFIAFVGPSGCGKSTLLRLIAGLDKPTSGSVSIDGKDVTQITAADRGLAMVFQSYALYPHMSVRQNLAFGLENTKVPKDEIETRINDAARMLEIEPFLRRRPGQLSGGQRQRVAIGRAIVRRPDAFLLDEPLSNLDAELRVSMRAELAALHARLKATMIYVTHDQVEAMTLADRIVVLRRGRIEQVGTPLELYNKPANRFVAGFIGAPHMNFLEGRIVGHDGKSAQIETVGGHRLSVPAAASHTAREKVSVGIRPQHVTLADQGASGTMETRITLVEELGSETVVHAEAEGHKKLVAVLAGQKRLKVGDGLALRFDPELLHLFGEDGDRLS
ncbi:MULTISPECIES: ABC transporter ATP-binding protein [unclassified Sinorhizobium]|uniref:ABC transporter ATP-binding protein n=1 Tax=unclassified Sinorhizobium TaxID=2613772 RepID=UPI00352646AC